MDKQVANPRTPYARAASEGADHYHRSRHLPALLALWPYELEDMSFKGTSYIISQLKVALLAERRRGRIHHWCYDLNRHLALVSALKGEKRHLTTTKNSNGLEVGIP